VQKYEEKLCAQNISWWDILLLGGILTIRQTSCDIQLGEVSIGSGLRKSVSYFLEPAVE
jgi:hypothetical protein